MTTRRALLAGSVGALVHACAGPVVEKPPPDPNAHPLSGLVSFRGTPVVPPPLVGRTTVIDFWASWCAPCRIAFRYLDQLYRTYHAHGLDVLAVSIDDDPDAGDRFRVRLRPSFPVAWDVSGEVRERFRISVLPTTLLLDEKGKVTYRHEGFEPDVHRLLEAHVRRLVVD